MRRPILVLTLVIVSGFSLGALTLGVDGAGNVQIVSAEGFGPKLQFGGGGTLRVAFPVLDWLDLGAGVGLFGLAASDTSGGFIYRGFWGGKLAVNAEASASIGSWERFGSLRAGGGLAIAAAIAKYHYTTLFFFYPELSGEGFVECRPAFLPRLGLRFSLPVSVAFRRDVDYAVAVGAGLGVSCRLGAAR
jgi:hypothetical protein